MVRPPPCSTLFPYTTLFRSLRAAAASVLDRHVEHARVGPARVVELDLAEVAAGRLDGAGDDLGVRSEEHTSELQSHHDLVCRLLLEKKKNEKQQEAHEKDAA